MAGIVPALETRDRRGALGQQIDRLALTLIAPLHADDDDEAAHQERTKNSMASPTRMLKKPPRRSSRSSIADSFANSRFMPDGFMKGTMPSTMQTMANAASRSVQSSLTEHPEAALAPAGAVQVLEELALGR